MNSSYYYSRLTDDKKAIYKTILAGLKAFDKEIKIQLMPMNEITMIFNYVLFDNPLIFYVSQSFQQLRDLYNKKCFIVPEYKYPKPLSKEFTTAITKYLQVFDSLKEKSDLDKELFVHNYCLETFTYDYQFGDSAHSVLGVVMNKTAVCEGIAKFVKLAFDYLGLSSLVVVGKAKSQAYNDKMEPHAWNIVKINGNTYHLDVTFDMTLTTKMNRYDYFNLSEEDIKKDHIITGDIPACTIVGNDYFSTNLLIMHSRAEFENHIVKSLKQNKKNILVKITNIQNTKDIADKIMEIAVQQYGKIYNSSVKLEIGYNLNQMVFEINFK
ncbi:hypothetical protein AGMMS49938_17440 [Fibrobacterales bacterium]|nr:hypothetical protein AGMMS49938_17440 [Fibrobacterales bacterium]